MSLQPYMPMDMAPDRAAAEAARWHAAWAVLALAGAGTVVLIAGQVPAAVLTAFAALIAAGALGWVLHDHGRVLIALWTAAALFAVGASGGLTGPGAAWALMPAAAGAALGRGWRLRWAAVTTVLLLAALAEASAVSADAPEGLTLGMTALAALGTTAWAFISTARRRPPTEPQNASLVDPREAERAKALALELEAARAETNQLKDEAEALRAQAEAAEAGRVEARASDQAKSRFLATMSHELRTPLNAVMGFADIMRNRLFGPLPDRYAEYSQLIHESGAHLLDLINDVLDLSKIEADRYRLERESFDAREAVETVLKLMRTQADDAGVTLVSNLPERPLNVEADKRALKQIALNLLGNAFKFTPAGGEVRLALLESDGVLELTVSDTGIGIAPEDLQRLGRPYEQAGDADARSLGTGLGLSLVRAFAGLHEGTMTLESTLGEGTAVTVRLPVLAPEAEMFADLGETAQVIPFSSR